MTNTIFEAGDRVKVTTLDPKSKKQNAAPFEGVVIAKKGMGENKTFTVRKVASAAVAVERIFPLNSPNISIKIAKKGDFRRAKLYYLRKSK